MHECIDGCSDFVNIINITICNISCYADLFTIIGTIIGVVGIWFIYRKLRYDKGENIFGNTVKYLRMYYDPNYVEDFIKASNILSTGKTKLTNKDERRSVGIFLAYFEELGYMYINNRIDKNIIKDQMGLAIIAAFEISEIFIDFHNQRSYNFYSNFETMYLDVKNNLN